MRGFTLVEMLITMVLLSSVVLIGSSAFGFFAQRWDGQLGKFDSTMQNVRDLLLVHEVLDSLVPYVAYDKGEVPVIYFEGNRNGFIGVSSRSVLEGDGFSVVRFSIAQNSDFSFDVLYEEWPMKDDILRSAQQEIPFSLPLRLFNSVDSPKFEYFGWASSEEKYGVEGIMPAGEAKWLADYNALNKSFPPLKARLVFEKNGQVHVISAVLAAAKAGLVSRYSGSRGRLRNERGEPVEPAPECWC